MTEKYHPYQIYPDEALGEYLNHTAIKKEE